MKKTALFVILALVIAAPVFAQGPFNDVPTDHWAYDAVNQLQKDGVVIGYPDGTFGGKRAMTRYEFAVAIARVMEAIPTAANLSDYATKSYVDQAIAKIKPAEPVDLSKYATKADVDALRRLIDEFRDEIAALGVDVDALKRDVCALAARVEALEIEQRRVRFTGSANVVGISTTNQQGTPFDLDNRQVRRDDTLGRNITYIQDFDLNLVGRVSDSTSALATINYGNYLNYLVAVDDYVDGFRPSQKGQTEAQLGGNFPGLANGFGDSFFPYYLYIDTAIGKGALTVGRFPMQFTPYTFKKIDVDSYTSILKTDSGDYPVDGIKLGYSLGGVDLVLYAAKHNENDYLVNGLTGQPRAGLFDTALGGFTTMHELGGNSVGGLTDLISQSAGVRAQFGIPWNGNVGVTYYQAWSQDAFDSNVVNGSLFDQARVFGADLAIPFGCNFGLAGSWTQSDTLAADKAGVTRGDITDNNTAWDAKLTAGFGKLGFGAGYKNIERNFAAAGSWDKIGRWTNPVNVKGPYVDFNYPISSKIKLVLNGEWLKAIDTVAPLFVDDQILKGEAGLQWGFSAANSVALGVQWIQYTPDDNRDEGTEAYYTIGWAHQLNPNAGLKVAYQFFNWDGGANHIVYGNDYRAGLGVVQFGVNF